MHGYVNGMTTQEIAGFADVGEDDVEIFLTSWCDRGCPGVWL